MTFDEYTMDEHQTRKEIIDAKLNEAGWDLADRTRVLTNTVKCGLFLRFAKRAGERRLTFGEDVPVFLDAGPQAMRGAVF